MLISAISQKKQKTKKKRFNVKILSFGVIPHQITTHFKGNEKDKNTEPPTTIPALHFVPEKKKKKEN